MSVKYSSPNSHCALGNFGDEKTLSTLSAPGLVKDLLVRLIPPDRLELSWLPTSVATAMEVVVTDLREDGSSMRASLLPSTDHKIGEFPGAIMFHTLRRAFSDLSQPPRNI